MSLDTIQHVLARLYVDSALRARFLRDPDVIGRELGLNASEIEQLAQLQPQQINLFASSLKRKRLNAVRGLLPLTNQALGAQFSRFFGEYAETYNPQGVKKHQDDAVMFCNFLATQTRLEPPWAIDVAKYERGGLWAAQPQFRGGWCRFEYAIAPLLRHLNQNEAIASIPEQAAIAIWWRFSSATPLHYTAVPIPKILLPVFRK
jgi:hypothetical protein